MRVEENNPGQSHARERMPVRRECAPNASFRRKLGRTGLVRPDVFQATTSEDCYEWTGTGSRAVRAERSDV